MTQAHFDRAPQVSMADAGRSLDASDDFDLPPVSTRYCPTTLIGTFTLLMAGHGRCVNSSMMLGDREYAMWQLARAQTLPDDELRAIALRLFAYFDEPRSRINVFA
jgi:hypothetical protein